MWSIAGGHYCGGCICPCTELSVFVLLLEAVAVCGHWSLVTGHCAVLVWSTGVWYVRLNLSCLPPDYQGSEFTRLNGSRTLNRIPPTIPFSCYSLLHFYIFHTSLDFTERILSCPVGVVLLCSKLLPLTSETLVWKPNLRSSHCSRNRDKPPSHSFVDLPVQLHMTIRDLFV